MMIAISSVLFDLDGDVIIDALPESDLGETSRRVNKVKTLDLGVEVTDRGHTEADRDFTIRWKTRAPAFEAKINNLVTLHGQLYICTIKGCHKVTPSSFRSNVRGVSTLSLLGWGRVDL